MEMRSRVAQAVLSLSAQRADNAAGTRILLHYLPQAVVTLFFFLAEIVSFKTDVIKLTLRCEQGKMWNFRWLHDQWILVSVFKLSEFFFTRGNFYFIRFFINNPCHKMDDLITSFSYLNRKMWPSAFFLKQRRQELKHRRSQTEVSRTWTKHKRVRTKSHCLQLLDLNVVTKHTLAFALDIQNTRIHCSSQWTQTLSRVQYRIAEISLLLWPGAEASIMGLMLALDIFREFTLTSRPSFTD